MIWPFKKKLRTEHVWEYAPYAFEPGRKYIIEVDAVNINMDELKSLQTWILENGLNIKLVVSAGKDRRVLRPIEVKGYKEIIE